MATDHGFQTITLIIAIYGAALSTFLAVLSTAALIMTARKDRKRAKLFTNIGFRFREDETVDAEITEIGVVNIGQRELVVNAPELRVSKKKKVILFIPGDGYDNFPTRLHDCAKGQIRFDNRDIEKALKDAGFSGKVKLQAYATDQSGGEYWGEPFTFIVEDTPIAR
jgi:hypothetical protein